MKFFLDASLIIAVFTMLAILSTSRIVFSIRLAALQGIALSVIPLMVSHEPGGLIVVLFLGTLMVKGIILPQMLLRARREANIPREMEPYIGFGASSMIGVGMLAFAFGLGARLPLPEQATTELALASSFFLLFSGLFLIVARRKAFMQVIGYLALENGIYIFGVSFVHNQPLLIEMGVLLDLFVAVFVMGIAIFHISRTFDHIDTDRLRLLKDVIPVDSVQSS